ncbi:MAG TPA: sigma-E factor regulatory protein RseB domain-containing protein [Streptosporangiaceae bacterium]
MEFRSRAAAGTMSPGTDPTALRLITTAVVVGLVMSGVALASWRGLVDTGGGAGPAAPGRAPGGPVGAAQAAGLRLLSEAAVACRSVSYEGVEMAWWGPSGDTSVVDIWHQPGGQAVIQAPAEPVEWPAQAHQSVPLSGAGRADLTAVTVLGMTRQLVELLGANYVVAVTGRGSVAGRPARIVTVRRRAGSLAAWFWLDSSTGLPLRKEMFDTRARMISNVAFTELSLGPGAVTSEPSAGARPWHTTLAATRLARLRAGGWPLPGPLLGHLALISARQSSTPAGPVVDLDYSDGLSVVSVFVQRGYLPATLGGWSEVALAGHRIYANEPDNLSFAWSARGYVYTLIAAAPRDTVGQVVAALPHDGDTGLLARLGRGLHRLLDWLTP